MIRHVVLLHLTDDIDRPGVAELVECLNALPAQIDAITNYQVGVDLELSESNATIAVIGDFAGKDAYESYRDHPAHRRLIEERIAPVLARRSAIQFRAE